jgi:hypothetical protein
VRERLTERLDALEREDNLLDLADGQMPKEKIKAKIALSGMNARASGVTLTSRPKAMP